jgi:hypothetical protein
VLLLHELVDRLREFGVTRHVGLRFSRCRERDSNPHGPWARS